MCSSTTVENSKASTFHRPFHISKMFFWLTVIIPWSWWLFTYSFNRDDHYTYNIFAVQMCTLHVCTQLFVCFFFGFFGNILLPSIISYIWFWILFLLLSTLALPVLRSWRVHVHTPIALKLRRSDWMYTYLLIAQLKSAEKMIKACMWLHRSIFITIVIIYITMCNEN